MPTNTIQTYLKGQLDGMVLPLDLGTLTAYIAPPNPGEAVDPVAYIWGSHADERRAAVPRAQPGNLSTGGWKVITHRPNIWLIWFGPSDDPNADVLFPAVLDAVCGLLRNVPILDQTQHATDPVTGQVSDLLNVGEQMSWEYGPVRATADQRYLRYDAQITPTFEEWLQA